MKKMPFSATCMDLEVIILSEVSQKKTNIWYHLHVESIIWYKWTYLWIRNKQKQIHRHGEQTCPCQGVGVGGVMDWDFGNSRCKVLYIWWVNKKGPLLKVGYEIYCTQLSQAIIMKLLFIFPNSQMKMVPHYIFTCTVDPWTTLVWTVWVHLYVD